MTLFATVFSAKHATNLCNDDGIFLIFCSWSYCRISAFIIYFLLLVKFSISAFSNIDYECRFSWTIQMQSSWRKFTPSDGRRWKILFLNRLWFASGYGSKQSINAQSWRATIRFRVPCLWRAHSMCLVPKINLARLFIAMTSCDIRMVPMNERARFRPPA